ncbi:6827_t:CDS:1, partial [Acaulospora morrowiae]
MTLSSISHLPKIRREITKLTSFLCINKDSYFSRSFHQDFSLPSHQILSKDLSLSNIRNIRNKLPHSNLNTLEFIRCHRTVRNVEVVRSERINSLLGLDKP